MLPATIASQPAQPWLSAARPGGSLMRLTLGLAAICLMGAGAAQAQQGLPTQNDAPSLNTTSPGPQPGQPNSQAAAPSPQSGLGVSRPGPPPKLPSDAGQVWQEYDLRPYTKQLSSIDRPHQAVVDWVLRETGSDAWFTDPFGFINADHDTLRVYHNREMQKVVQGVHERFVNGTSEPQLYGLRIVSVGNPNWRTRAHGLMRSVQAQSPGVQAYLLSKENSALLMSLLRGRSDFKEISATDMSVYNGQSQMLEQIRGRNFVQDLQPAPGSWPPYMPVTGEIKEGYRLQLSPLLSLDKSSVDLVMKCNIDQVERLAKVNLELPMQSGQAYSGQINVPQVASWRLHERFRWPSDQVLLLSCGVVAAPQGTSGPPAAGSLLGQGSSMLGLDRMLSSTGERAEALLMIEYRGDANDRLPAGGEQRTAQPSSNPLSRGRY